MDSTQGWWYPGQGKAVQGLKYLLGLLPSLHRTLRGRWVPAAAGENGSRAGAAPQSSRRHGADAVLSPTACVVRPVTRNVFPARV